MAGLAFPLAAGLGGDASVSGAISRDAQLELWGEDILFTDDFQLTPAGDYATVTGMAALKQAVWIRLATRPGEVAWEPDFGVGVTDYMGRISSASAKAELLGRVRDQLLQDPRLSDVLDADVQEQTINSANVLVVSVRIAAAGQVYNLDPLVFGVS